MTKRSKYNAARRGLLTLLALALALTGVFPLAAQERLRVGVWNIEKLSATASRGFPELQGSRSLPPRTDADLQKMAEYIRDDLQVDALMVTEVEADSPLSTDDRPQSEQLNRVAEAMGSNWKYFLGRTGDDLRLGLLFNTDRVRLKKIVNLHAPEFSISGKDVLARDPFIAWISAINENGPQNDLILICVHLKSQQGPFKDNRMAAIAKLIGDFNHAQTRSALTLPSKSEEPEAILLGDCNDSSFKLNGFKYMFDYLDGVGFTHVRNASGEYPHTRVNGSQIDHLFATKKVVNSSMVPDSFRVHTVPASPQSKRKSYRKSLSDHFPVTLDIKIRSDDDFTFGEALATADPGARSRRMADLQEEAFARAAGVFGAAEELEDDDESELSIEADIRDNNFEDILAPFTPPEPGSAGISGPSSVAPIAPNPQDGRRVPGDRFAKSSLPIIFLEQNWTPEEAVEFYSLRQGSPLMRRDFFHELEQPDSTDFFHESNYLASFGFLPRRPHEGNVEGYPIGFTGTQAIELTCAACHTSKLTYHGKEYWIDGSQAMTDIESWLNELVRAIKLTLNDAPSVIRDDSQFAVIDSSQRISLDQNTKFGRFVRRLTSATNPSAAQAKVIYDLLNKDLARRQRYNDYNSFGRSFDQDSDRDAATKHSPYGFSRLDALGAILNQACAEHLDASENARSADAPVNYPAIWDAPQHVHVQWNGAVDNTARFGPLGRNAGQVIGVFGLLETEGTTIGYESSINFDSLNRAEELITKLWSPEWPEDFGAIDQAKAAQGEAVYRANCIQCHSIIDRDDPQRRANDVLVPIHRNFGTGGMLGTDEVVAKRWMERQAKVGRLAGRLKSLPFSGRFPANRTEEVPARDILSHLVFNAISRSFVPWRDELTIEDEHAPRSMAFSPESADEELMRYKARPLNGVWSTSPYLHNGSVLNMVELLTPPSDRKKKFRVGTTEFDPETLGYKNAGPFEFDTALKGNRKEGHDYGTKLSPEKKQQLIEFIKTL